MGSYWYIEDPDSEFGHVPIYEDDYVRAIFRIADKHGLEITDKMILEEIKKNWSKKKK